MPVKLRGHHLLCILSYQSRGYSKAFVEQYDSLIARLNSGEMIEIVSEPDEICRPMLAEQYHHCHKQSVDVRDSLALEQLSSILRIQLHPGESLKLNQQMLKIMRRAFAAGTIRSACESCEWSDLCGRIARTDFKSCLLQIPRASL